jgi:hypothetical protein
MNKIDQLMEDTELFLSIAESFSRKEYKLLEPEFINSDPELKKKHLEQLKIRQQRWRDKQDPTRLTQQSSDSWSKVKALQENNPLKFLLIHLGRQIAFRRKDEKKKNNPTILNIFEQDAAQVINFRDKINSYVAQAVHNEPALSALINEGENLSLKVKNTIPNAKKTIDAIVNELNNIFDQHNRV